MSKDWGAEAERYEERARSARDWKLLSRRLGRPSELDFEAQERAEQTKADLCRSFMQADRVPA